MSNQSGFTHVVILRSAEGSHRDSSRRAQNDISLRKRQNGIVALSVTLLLSAVIVEIAVIGAIIAYTLTNANYNARLGSEAIAAARAGLADAMMKIVRDKNWSSIVPYSLSVGGGSVDVTVVKDSPSVGKREIIATGKAFTRRQKIRAIVDVNDVTGVVRLVEALEVAS